MCILCVVQKWARRVATMLPWLVIPLIGLWLLSQLLPPAFRFEITSPRLACVSVLLVTLFWYEILMPQLSTWRARSNARQRERKRFEAIELQKLRKTATRRCRNCLTPYRDQNPGGGKFMCSYCGHLSKRPVLDLPVPPGLGRSNSGILKDLVGKGGKILNGKAWSDNAWMCGRQEWLENGDWVGGSFTGNSSYRRYGAGLFTGENDCPAENSFSCIFIFVCKSFATLPFSIMWLWRKVFKINPSGVDSASDMEGTGALDERGDNMGNCHQSKGDKARRKAEEKRQARLEKELMEEEERKQREEVARLVEERRKLRGETIEVEKERVKGSPPHKGRESKREAEKKRGERKKERDRLSSRSNSDAEEFERRASKESDRYKKSEYDRRENHRGGSENVRARGTEAAYVSKGFLVNNSRGYSGTRYLDRVKGTLLSSSRAFTGGGFFGKSLNTTVCREQKTNFLTDHGQTSVNRREVSHPDLLSGRLSTAGDDKNISCPVPIESHSSSPPKKSWQQLFTRSSSVSPPSSSNVISKPNDISQSEVQSPPVTSNSTTAQPFGNPINVGLPSPFVTSSLSFGISTSSGFPLLSDSMLSPIGKPSKQYSSEEPEDFGDPCYVPEMVSLLGPVSESLGLGAENEPRKAADLKDIPASTEVVRPSPIESPMSRLRISEERNINPFSFQSIPAASQDVHNIDRSNNIDEAKTWQMWSSSPLVQNDLGLIGGTASWILPEVVNKPKSEEILNTGPPKTTASLFTGDDHSFYGTDYPQKVFNGSIQNGGMLNIPLPGGSGSDVSWLPKTSYGPVSGREEDHFSVKPVEDAKKNGNIFRYSNSNHQSEVPVANFWPKKDDDNVKGGSTRMSNNGSSPTLGKPHIGGLYSNPDVQSLWSYD